MDPIERERVKLEQQARQRAERVEHDARVEAVRRQVLATASSPNDGGSAGSASPAPAPQAGAAMAPATAPGDGSTVPVARLVSHQPATDPGPAAPPAPTNPLIRVDDAVARATPAALAWLRSLSTEARVGLGLAALLVCFGCMAWGLVRRQAEREREREREAGRLDAERQEHEWLAEEERAAAAEKRKHEATATAERERLERERQRRAPELAAERERAEQARLEREREAQARVERERAEREAAERPRAADERTREELRAQEAVAGPRPKFSAWDASIYCVVKHMERYAHDPESLDFTEWSPLLVQERNGVKCWAVRAVYRARVPAGGLVRKEAIFYIRNERVIDVVER